MYVTCDLLCWITTILACMLVGLKSLMILLDYRSYMGSSMINWSLRWFFLYLCSYYLDGSVTRLRRPPGAWRLVDDVGADRRGRRRRTTDRWPDTRRRVSSVQTESAIQSPWPVTKARSLPTFYSWFTRWFWLRFVPLGRATQDLQVCLQDQSPTRPGFQSTKLPSTLLRNCVDSDLGKFG